MSIQQLEAKKATIDAKIAQHNAELQQIDRDLAAAGVGPDTDVDEFLADLEKKRDDAKAKFDEQYAIVAKEIADAEALLEG